MSRRSRQERFAKGTHSVLLVQLEELALLEEENRVVVVLFDLPELALKGRERLPRRRRDVERARVVAGLSRADAVGLRRKALVGRVPQGTAKGETHVLRVDKEAEHLLIGRSVLLRFLCDACGQ